MRPTPVDTADFAAAVAELGATLDLPPADDAGAVLRAALAQLEHLVSDDAAQPPSPVPALSLRDVPPGLATGDAVVDDGVRVLRLLHLRRLRNLQGRVNGLLAAAQAITMNPQMDLSLGKVGL